MEVSVIIPIYNAEKQSSKLLNQLKVIMCMKSFVLMMDLKIIVQM